MPALALKNKEDFFTQRLEQEAGYSQYLNEAKTDRELYQLMRPLCLRDLYFLLVYVLGRKDARRDWLFDRCCEIQAAPNGYLDLWAREHYKSTIITFTKTIQDILNNSELVIGIFSHTRPIAKAFLVQIKREFESNTLLQQLFPDILYENPKREAPVWSLDSGIIVKRKGNPKEATVEAHGLVDGQPTSRHFDIMVYDDVVTRESVYTPEMIIKTTEGWELSLNLGKMDGVRRTIGTRYHTNDTYKTMIDRKSVIPRIYPATWNAKADGFPVLMTKDKLAEKRRDMGLYTFGSQMLQDPTADQVQGFKEVWLKYWQPDTLLNLTLYLLVDSAGSKKKKNNDWSVFEVIGLGADGNYYLVDMVRDKLNLTERAKMLFYLHRKYDPKGTGYEEYGMQADIEYCEEKMVQENYRFTITALGGQLPKEERIRRLIPYFETGRWYIPKILMKKNYEGKEINVINSFIHEEYNNFPVAEHDDMLDCMARILDPMMNATLLPRKKKALSLDQPADMRGFV